jgi:hypothetical protein
MTVSTSQRRKLHASRMGLPGRLAYPMPDASHAANAKARASQQVGKSITAAQKAEIDRKANRILGK